MTHPPRGARPVKILWVSDSPLVASGFGRVTRAVTERLARIPGIEVACLGWSHDGWPYDRSRYAPVIYPAAPHVHGRAQFDRALEELQPDVVITLAEIWMIDWLQSHPLRRRFKWIGYFPLDGGPFYPPWEPVLKDVDELVAMSEFGRGVFQSGVPSRRIHLIHHGVDTSVFRPLEERGRLKSHERLRGKFVVGYVARNQPRKSIPALVKAFATLAGRLPELHLYLHMDPCDVGYDIVTLLQRHGLEGRADVSGPDFNLRQALEDEELNRLYNLFDVTVLPTMGEGFGLPIIESQAAGVPVIATDCSACTELVRGRGELVRVLDTMTVGTNLLEHALIDTADLADCIERLYRSPELVRQHAAAGVEFARCLDWDRLIPQWTRVIKLAAGASSSNRAS